MSAVYQDLAGKVVLITGGANGIGAAMVESFSQQGAKVYFCDLDDAAGKQLVQHLEGQLVFRKLNLEREASIRSWIKQVGEKEGAIHAVINNAASDPRISFDSMTSQQWDALFARNLKAYFLTVQSALPWLNKGASIVNFASITFHIGPTAMTAYVSTKGGIIGFTRALARELGVKGIRVNTLSPGWIMTERQLKQFVDASVKKMIRKAQCMPELLEPKDIAHIAMFLASNASSALTGQEILADRGWAYS